MVIGLNELVIVFSLAAGVFFLNWENKKKWYLYVGMVSLIIFVVSLTSMLLGATR
jgi:hypothetical protein